MKRTPVMASFRTHLAGWRMGSSRAKHGSMAKRAGVHRAGETVFLDAVTPWRSAVEFGDVATVKRSLQFAADEKRLCVPINAVCCKAYAPPGRCPSLAIVSLPERPSRKFHSSAFDRHRGCAVRLELEQPKSSTLQARRSAPVQRQKDVQRCTQHVP